jgi:Flp pilus assembly protein TadB
MIGLAVTAGLLAGLAVLVLIDQLRPPPPHLHVILDRIHPARLEPPTHHRPTLTTRIGHWATERLTRPTRLRAIPHQDLAVLGKPVETFMTEKLLWFGAGLLLPPLASAALTWAGATTGWALPAIAALALAAVGFHIPDLAVRSTASQHRRDFRHALSCYLQLVVLEREAGAALGAALEEPTKIADTWAFRRIGQALERARRGGQQPWQALADLGEHLGIHDLHDLAYTAKVAGGEGAKTRDILNAKITSMRREASTATRSQANTRTTTMWVPVSLLMLGFVVLVGFPFFYRLINPT